MVCSVLADDTSPGGIRVTSSQIWERIFLKCLRCLLLNDVEVDEVVLYLDQLRVRSVHAPAVFFGYCHI